jgi:hypothetical protein
MSYKKNNSTAIMVAVSIIALALVTATSFNHSYTAFAASKKAGGGGGASHTNGVTTLGGSSSSAATGTPNSNALTKKELSSLISCINAANKSQGLTHKVVTNCLDMAKGITPASTIGRSSVPSSIASTATLKS